MFGVLICTKVAMELALEQAGVTGHVFNTVGVVSEEAARRAT